MEPWIRVHANIASKPVVLRAASALRVHPNEAIGLLVRFWGQLSQHGRDGCVATLDDLTIETWAGWRGKRGAFAAFVRAHHTDEDGRVNEWDQYAGALEARRAMDRERQSRRRGQQPMSRGHPRDIRVTSDENPADVTRESDESHADVTRMSIPARAIRDETIRDETKREDRRRPETASSSSSSSSADVLADTLEARLVERLPVSARLALGGVLSSASSPSGRVAIVQLLHHTLDGERGAHLRASPDQLAAALQDYAANGLSDGRWNSRHFDGHLQRVLRAPPRESASQSGAPPDGRAALLVGQIMSLIEEVRQPGQGVHRFIPRAKVLALGQDVAMAYDAVGGAERFLASSGDKHSFLIRDFSQTLEAIHVSA